MKIEIAAAGIVQSRANTAQSGRRHRVRLAPANLRARRRRVRWWLWLLISRRGRYHGDSALALPPLSTLQTGTAEGAQHAVWPFSTCMSVCNKTPAEGLNGSCVNEVLPCPLSVLTSHAFSCCRCRSGLCGKLGATSRQPPLPRQSDRVPGHNPSQPSPEPQHPPSHPIRHHSSRSRRATPTVFFPPRGPALHSSHLAPPSVGQRSIAP